MQAPTGEPAFPCAELQLLIGADAFNSVALWWQFADIGVYDLALNLGWHKGMPDTLWYQRLDGDQNVSLPVQPGPGGQQCTGYLMDLMARREEEGRGHSPLDGDGA